MTQDLHPWASALSTLHDQVWTRLIRGVRDRHAAARHPTLATVSRHGKPQARTVVLRAADRSTACLDLYTDGQSAKCLELGAEPWAAVHVWDHKARLQMRLEAEVSLLTGSELAAIWARLPEASRASYGGSPAPGQPISSALAYRKAPDEARFTVLRLRVQELDVLHLGADHRRARFSRADGWVGQWLAP